jgi:predicted transcriptional regulator
MSHGAMVRVLAQGHRRPSPHVWRCHRQGHHLGEVLGAGLPLTCPCTTARMPSLTIRLAPDLLDALETTAAAQGTTRTALVTAALAQYLQLPPEPMEARLEAIESRIAALESSRATPAPTRQDTMGGDGNTPAGLSQLEALIKAGAIPPGTPRGSANGMIRRRYQQSPEDFLEALGWTLHGSGNRRRWYPPEDVTNL